jgi:pilus assembly protein FimV
MSQTEVFLETKNRRSGFFKASALVLALASAFTANEAWALTVGRLTAQSAVGQPLRATLAVPAISAAEAATLQVRVAGPDRFAAASMVLNSVLNDARFELVPPTNGQSTIQIQTTRPVTEPFLDLVLEFQWGGGQLVRTYTLLLEPPNLQHTRPQDSASVLAPALSANTAPIPRFEPLQPITPPAPVAAARTTDDISLVREVTTRSSAASVTPSDSGLVRELPEPRLAAPFTSTPAPEPVPAPSSETPLVREILSMPDTAPNNLVRELPEPRAEVTPQRAPAPVTPPRFEPLEETTTIRVVRGDTAARIAQNHMPPGISLDQMLVSMLQANPRAFIDGNVNLIRAGARVNMPDFNEASQISAQQARQMVRAQTRDFNAYRRRLASAAPTQTTPEADQRITGQVQEQVDVASPTATEADRLEISRGSVSEQAPTETIAQQMQQDATVARLDELSRNLRELEALAQAAGTAEADGTTDGTEEQPTDLLAIAGNTPSLEVDGAADTQVTETVTEQTAAEKAKSFVERWLKNPWTVPLALLLIAVLAILGWSRARALRKQNAFQNSAKTPAPQAVDPDLGAMLAAAAAPATMPADESPDSNDPISEAEVYLAYGMDEQAENLLRQALAANPDGLKERLKLLEVYQSRQDLLAFNTLAQEVFEMTLGETENWEQVARAGMKLDPGNPLYHAVHDTYNHTGDLPPDVKDLSLDLGGLDTPQDGNKRQP